MTDYSIIADVADIHDVQDVGAITVHVVTPPTPSPIPPYYRAIRRKTSQIGRNRTLGHEYLHKGHNDPSMHRLPEYLPNGGKCVHRASFPS